MWTLSQDGKMNLRKQVLINIKLEKQRKVDEQLEEVSRAMRMLSSNYIGESNNEKRRCYLKKEIYLELSKYSKMIMKEKN